MLAPILIFAATYLVLAIGRLPGFRVDRIGAMTSAQLAAAYGTTQPTGKPIPATTTVASSNDGTDGWEIAALGGAALLAACGLGGAYMVRARRRTVEA